MERLPDTFCALCIASYLNLVYCGCMHVYSEELVLSASVTVCLTSNPQKKDTTKKLRCFYGMQVHWLFVQFGFT